MEYASKETNIADAETLSEIFEQSINLLNYIEETDQPSNNPEYQNSVKKAITLLEKATHMVNQLSMFSSNETIEEVATSDLKYLLLPSLLGYFTIKLVNPNPEDRRHHLSLSELYYKDFLKRCKSYELPNVTIPEIEEEEEKKETDNQKSQSAVSNLETLTAARNEKIRQYKILKEIESEMNRLKEVLKIDDNHDKKREYYLVLLKRWVLRACDELSSIKMEKSLLENMPKSKSTVKEKKQDTKPLKPIIIVKNELQKKVYGLGYPSMPAMTVDEFYRQRYPDAENGNSTSANMQSLQQMAVDPDETKRQLELENAQEEYLIEVDDPLKLERVRAFDDWKDENRRGCGNRKNKG